MAHVNRYPFNSRTSGTPRPRPRPIDEFSSSQEFLMAIYDAVESHRRQYIRTGEIHGNITPATVWIGSPSVASNRMGFLMESSDTQELFQSVNLQASNVLCHPPVLPLDYVDDLESFYYIIAYISMSYAQPSVQLHPMMYPPALATWAIHPERGESVLEKEERLKGLGFYDASKRSYIVGGKRLAGVFAKLLAQLHSQLKVIFMAKLKGNFDHLDPENLDAVYSNFMGALKNAIRRVHEKESRKDKESTSE